MLTLFGCFVPCLLPYIVQPKRKEEEEASSTRRHTLSLSLSLSLVRMLHMSVLTCLRSYIIYHNIVTYVRQTPPALSHPRWKKKKSYFVQKSNTPDRDNDNSTNFDVTSFFFLFFWSIWGTDLNLCSKIFRTRNYEKAESRKQTIKFEAFTHTQNGHLTTCQKPAKLERGILGRERREGEREYFFFPRGCNCFITAIRRIDRFLMVCYYFCATASSSVSSKFNIMMSMSDLRHNYPRPPFYPPPPLPFPQFGLLRMREMMVTLSVPA